MNNSNNKKMILTYIFVIFSAIFIGTIFFLILNSKKPPAEKKEVTISPTVPTTVSTEGSIHLVLENEEIPISTDKEITIDLVAGSNEKNIVGYDLALSYDSSAFEFMKATSNVPDFEVYTYKKDGYLSFLVTKSPESQTPSVFNQTKISSLIFKPIKTGKYSFALKPFIDQDKTDLVTDQTEVMNPELNELQITIH